MNTTFSDRFSDSEIAGFNSDGYLVARALASSAESAALREAASRQLNEAAPPLEFEVDTHYPGAPVSPDAQGGKTVRRLLQAYARDPQFARWALLPAIAARLRQLLGMDVELSQAHHNCVMTKHPRYSSATLWHQDIRYWSFQRPDLISVWTALGREQRENGCLLVLPGTHRMEFAPNRYDAALFLRPELDENKALIATRRLVELEAGDVLFFHCRLFHAAGSNRTNETKLSLVYSYHSAANRPMSGTRSASLPDIALP